MNSIPAATPIPIDDIVGLRDYFPYPVWMVVLAALILFFLVGWALWFFVFRKKPVRALTARERARKELARAEAEVEGTDPYVFGIRVSDTLRIFIEAETGLRATTQTSMEFLSEIRERPVFSGDEKAALSLFLERADLIKFARAHATSADSRQLLESAERIVDATKPAPERKGK